MGTLKRYLLTRHVCLVFALLRCLLFLLSKLLPGNRLKKAKILQTFSRLEQEHSNL